MNYRNALTGQQHLGLEAGCSPNCRALRTGLAAASLSSARCHLHSCESSFLIYSHNKAISSCAVQQSRQVLRFLTGLQIIGAVELSLFKLEPFAVFRQLPSSAPCVHLLMLLTAVLNPLGPHGGERQPDWNPEPTCCCCGAEESPCVWVGMARRSWKPFQTCKPGAVPSSQVFPLPPSGAAAFLEGRGKGSRPRNLLPSSGSAPAEQSGGVCRLIHSQMSCRGAHLAERSAGCKEELIFSELQGTAAGSARPASVALQVRADGSRAAAWQLWPEEESHGDEHSAGRAELGSSGTILADGSSSLVPWKQDVVLSPRLMAPQFQELASLVFLVFPSRR